MLYHCSGCEEKHAGDGLMLQCCGAYMCRRALEHRMNSRKYGWLRGGVPCPECGAGMPTFVRITEDMRIQPLSRVNAIGMRMLLVAAEMISLGLIFVTPAMAISIALYVALNMLGVCVAVAGSASGFCFTMLPTLRAFSLEWQTVLALTVVSVIISIGFGVISLIGSHAIAMVSRRFMRERLSLYYNHHTFL